ncbi:hypothetical protein OJF2_42300 [Aquisphaera giovannonii]|uniref:Uncharacterized protein n=1 Tax=Aquisphaera giovannonii TaxID=406548 RepID=A0A5B9W6C1_9BACT|nr:hypothetical protein [Aquisphaera giovannonii]QEH35675.1 hypothetical protein OJF2_42300 [Aquisphaera giovannonii]
MGESGSKVRKDRRFRPGVAGGQGLEPRVLLTAAGAAAARRQALVQARATARLTPTAKIAAEFNSFLKDFAAVQAAYVRSINEQSSSTVTVSANLTQPYSSGSSTMTVDDATVFGPQGTFSTPVVATASINGVSTGNQYTITGVSGSNTLILDVTNSTQASLPAGATLSAGVQSTTAESAGAIFPSFIINRTNLMATNLVQYFNNLPGKLPYFNAPPHTPNNRGAIQSFVYSSVTGFTTNGLTQPTGNYAASLQGSLLSIALPTTAGADLTIYKAAVASAVQQSYQQMLNGVKQVYAGRLKINIPASNNRFGADASGSVPSDYLGSGGSGGSGGTGSGGTTG